jgi:uncharacterized Zn-finger protein
MQVKPSKFHNNNMSVVLVKNDNTTKYCPPQQFNNKQLHPRVALKFKNGKATCPYCGDKFQAK